MKKKRAEKKKILKCTYRQELFINSKLCTPFTTSARPCVRVSLPSKQELITALLVWNQMRTYVVIAIKKNGCTLRSNDNDNVSA